MPVVCVDSDTARLAHQVGQLSVYPCFNLDPTHSPQTLWSVLHFAAGMNAAPRNHVPYIAVADGKQLSNQLYQGQQWQWANALVQYLATAGYRSYVISSWREISGSKYS